MVEREPEWTPDEVSLFVAARQVEAERGPYGIPLSRATDPSARFVASDKPTINRAVQAANKAQERYFKQYPEARELGSALMWSVVEAAE